MKIKLLNLPGTNLGAWSSFLKELRVEYSLVSVDGVNTADLVVLPGVGHSEQYLKAISPLKHKLLSNEIKSVSICAGLQALCKFTEESQEPGLGLFELEVKKLKDSKYINTGFRRVGSGSYYFNHGYYVALSAEYGNGEMSSVKVENTEIVTHIKQKYHVGVQFHPELSGEDGKVFFREILEHLGDYNG